MTLRQVAARAGVSTATVSRTLNNPDAVQEATRRRVLAAARELNYHPNPHAQSLAGGRSRMLGVVVSNITNPFFLDILYTLERRAAEKGYELVVESTDYRLERLHAAIRRMKARPVAGFAVIASEADDAARRALMESKTPTAALDNTESPGRGGLTRVCFAHEDAMRWMVDYLYKLGHRRLGFVGHHSALDPLGARQRAFETSSEKYADVELAVETEEDSPAGGREAVRRMLATGFEPTAVVSINDFMAVGVLRGLRDAGLRTPEDVSVTGFDNIALSEYLYPALTTVNVPREEIGRVVFDAIVPERDRFSSPGARVYFEPEVVVRESTAPPSP